VDEPALSWISEVLGASDVHEVRSLTYGVVSDLRLVEADGTPLVLRRYERDSSVLQLLPDLVDDETRALRAARVILGKLVPEVIATDPSGDRAGQPALLMSYLPGAPVIHGLDPDRLAAPLALLHTSPVPSDLARFHHWFTGDELAVPEWTAFPQAWEALIEIVRDREPSSPTVFLHRDFHPGNLLWDGGELSGIVDWAFGCHGPRAADVAHTRSNLALVDGVTAANRFLTAYTKLVPDHRHHVWWDAADLLAFGGGFSGVLAFNAMGAKLDVGLLRSRTDAYVESLFRTNGAR
jgi:aminoglycoside phosphotransferase (APT) family kinase protein